MSALSKFEGVAHSLLSARTELNARLTGSRRADQAREFSLQGLYLTGIRSFEGFLEDQIVEIASGNHTWATRQVGGERIACAIRLTERRRMMVRDIILARKDYVDFLPYERTQDIAKVLFVGGRPFVNITAADRATLTRCLRVRNYIAHRSKSAYTKFYREYVSFRPLRIRTPRPIHYLDDNIRAGVSFFEHDVISLITIARFLS